MKVNKTASCLKALVSVWLERHRTSKISLGEGCRRHFRVGSDTGRKRHRTWAWKVLAGRKGRGDENCILSKKKKSVKMRREPSRIFLREFNEALTQVQREIMS